MADVKIRKLPDWVVETYRARAEAAGHSLEEELRVFLAAGATHGRQAFAKRAKVLQARLRRKYGEMEDSTLGIRADRDARG